MPARYLEPTQEAAADFFGRPHSGGEGGHYLIGPASERWDVVMLVRQASQESFLAFASNTDYLASIDHRTAAVEDSRLLPIMPCRSLTERVQTREEDS